MIKIISALSAAASVAALAPMSVTAGPFVNPELNVGVGSEDGLSSGSLELHGGYTFENGVYVQAGPALLFTTDDSSVELSGKAGQSWGPAYGEVSFITGDDQLNFGVKAGAKWEF